MLGAPIKASALVETTVPPGVESMTILFVAVGGICTLKPPVGVSVIALWGVTMPPITSDEMPPEYGPEIVIVAPGAATFGSTALICGDGTNVNAEADRRAVEADKTIGGLVNKFGSFTEGLLLPSVETI
jgi:hypothetical protein